MDATLKLSHTETIKPFPGEKESSPTLRGKERKGQCMNLSKMHYINGVWLPKSDNHICKLITNGRYSQINTLERALTYVKSFDRAIDIGGHCGLWSKYLVEKFNYVEAFEPVPLHRDCFKKNVVSKNYTLHRYGLGASSGKKCFTIDKQNTGHSHFDDEGDHEFELRSLDYYGFKDVGFIKIDVEGYEKFVLEGGKRLIQAQKPIICLEQKPHGFYNLETLAGVEYLKTLDYEVAERISDDYIMVPK